MKEIKTVEKKDETQSVEKRVTRIECILRLLQKELKEHFNIGAGVVSILMFAMLSISVMAGTTTVIDWGTGVSGTIGTAKVTTDGTNATLTVDKVVNSGTVSISGLATFNNITVSTYCYWCHNQYRRNNDE
jgi:hypothetical protein